MHLTNEMSENDKRQVVLDGFKEEMRRIKSVSEAENDLNGEGILREDNEQHREPLSIEVTTEIKILLSRGGGEDGFKLRFNNNRELLGGVYYGADWGEYKEILLNDEEAREVFEFYLYGDISGLINR